MTQATEPPASLKCTPDQVADVIAALGTLMRQLHKQDLALQNALSKLATDAPLRTTELDHIQHIDLVTQTHDDLARFLPELAACLATTDFDQRKLAKILRLQSLRDQLLDRDTAKPKVETPSGEVSLF